MLAIMGGTGIYSIDGLTIIEQHNINTPFGKPSAEIIIPAPVIRWSILYVGKIAKYKAFIVTPQ